MRLDDERESSNISDQRGGGRGFSGGGLKIGGIGAVVILLGSLYFGIDPRLVFSLLEGGNPASVQSSQTLPQSAGNRSGASDPQSRFVAKILASTEDVWSDQFHKMGRTYHAPTLVLFSGGTRSGCGLAQTAVGPFYCPADQRVYLDLDFFRELSDRMGAKGDFPRAYVIAHEIGHHVQNQIGLMAKVDALRGRMGAADRNALSVKVELQADCLAGVWANQANRARHILQTGDVEDGLRATAAVGDDTLQRSARGSVQPDSFTHGSAAQRTGWFRRGLDSGDITRCDTFSG
jgi:uncharacterized protein